MRLVGGCGILCLLIVLPVAQSVKRPREDDGCEWEQMSGVDSLAIPVCFKIPKKTDNVEQMKLESIVQPMDIKSYDAENGDAIDMKDKNVKAEYAKGEFVERYNFFVPVDTKLVCACPGSSYVEDQRLIARERIIHFEGNTNSFEATCDRYQNMKVHGRENNNLGAYKCGRSIEFGPQKIKDAKADLLLCPKAYSWEGIGFDVNLGGIERFNLLEICYDERNKRTIYVKHKWISGASVPGLAPNTFCWQGAQGNEEDIYKGWHRGHLAPVADFPIYELKFLTYFYQNAAPQSGSFNTGQWSQVENEVRKEFKEATIFTGTSNMNQAEFDQEAAELNSGKLNYWRRDVFWKIAIGTDNQGNEKVKGYIYLNQIKKRSYFEGKINENCLCVNKEGKYTGGYCFENADEVQQMTNLLLPEAKYAWYHKDFSTEEIDLLKQDRGNSDATLPVSCPNTARQG